MDTTPRIGGMLWTLTSLIVLLSVCSAVGLQHVQSSSAQPGRGSLYAVKEGSFSGTRSLQVHSHSRHRDNNRVGVRVTWYSVSGCSGQAIDSHDIDLPRGNVSMKLPSSTASVSVQRFHPTCGAHVVMCTSGSSCDVNSSPKAGAQHCCNGCAQSFEAACQLGGSAADTELRA